MHRVMGTQKLKQILSVTEPCWIRDLQSNLATGHDELHMLEATAREALACRAKSALGKCLALGGCSLKKNSLPSEAQYLREETGASLEISSRSLGRESACQDVSAATVVPHLQRQ